MLVMSARRASEEKLAEGSGRIKPHPITPVPVETTTTTGGDTGGLGKKDLPKVDPNNPLGDVSLVQQLRDQLSHYDFASMVASVTASPYGQSVEGKKLVDRYTRLNGFMGWFGRELDQTDADHPITLTSDPDHGDAPSTVYRERSGYVAVKTATSSNTTAENQLSTAEVAAIAGVLQQFPTRFPGRNSTKMRRCLSAKPNC
jgi:hypothetical protein